MLIVGIAGSIRSNFREIRELRRIVEEAPSFGVLRKKIESAQIVFSNSDIIVAFALLGAKLLGAEVRMISIANLFSNVDRPIEYSRLTEEQGDIATLDTLSIRKPQYTQMVNILKKCDGVILGTPVYFGDRSSVANKFFQIIAKTRLLEEKAFGIVSVGAKRNGGQETTNIYGLYEALMNNAVVVGNGPPTAQYGGTVVGGDRMHALKDTTGLETAIGVGEQVARMGMALHQGKKDKSKPPLNITMLLTMDTKDKRYEHLARKMIARSKNAISLINLTDHTIYRCIACDVCPPPPPDARAGGGYKCTVKAKNDYMPQIRAKLLQSDLIVIAGVNDKNLVYRYQAFTERTRFIRRENYELTSIPIVGLLFDDVTVHINPLHNLKVVTSYIRHNAPILKPIKVLLQKGEVIQMDTLEKALRIAAILKKGRAKVQKIPISYKAEGYLDRSQDHTCHLR